MSGAAVRGRIRPGLHTENLHSQDPPINSYSPITTIYLEFPGINLVMCLDLFTSVTKRRTWLLSHPLSLTLWCPCTCLIPSPMPTQPQSPSPAKSPIILNLVSHLPESTSSYRAHTLYHWAWKNHRILNLMWFHCITYDSSFIVYQTSRGQQGPRLHSLKFSGWATGRTVLPLTEMGKTRDETVLGEWEIKSWISNIFLGLFFF